MNDRQRICVFYSQCEHFNRLVRAVRDQNPAAHICTMVPSGFDASRDAELAAAVDEVVETERASYSPLHPIALVRLARRIRNDRFDRFVILYETLKLRGLAAFSAAPVCECWTAYGRIKPVSSSPMSTLSGHIARTFSGRIRFLRIWWCVHFNRVRTKPPEEHGE